MTDLDKRKLCIIIPTHWEHSMGGAEYQVKLLTNYLVKLKKFDIYHLSRTINSEFQPIGYEVRKIGNSRAMRFVFDAKGLYGALQQIQPDTIYQRVGCAYTGIAAFYCKRNNCNMIWHIARDDEIQPWSESFFRRFSFSYLNKKLLEYGIKHARHVVGQTNGQAVLAEKHYGRSLSKIIYNFHPPATEIIDKSEALQVLWVANIKKIKQPEIYIKLARDLSRHSVRFVMIGAMQADPTWANKIMTDIRATSNIDYMGQLPQNEVNAIMAKSHVLVNTSKFEGFSNTFIQAWMRETPVISYSVDPDNLLNQQGLGYCASGDYDNLLNQMEVLIKNSDLRTQMGQDARSYAIEKHSEENISELVGIF